MTSKSYAQLLADLKVERSYTRPYRSNDNPYFEAQFKTLKVQPTYPSRFGSLEDAKTWARPFFDWYNNVHYHSGLALMRPSTVHFHQTHQRLTQRQRVLNDAYQRHPERFPRGAPRVPRPPKRAWINPPA